MTTIGGATQAVMGKGDQPPENALPVEFVIPPEMPAEFATHVWLYDFGEAHGAYELTLHRVNVPTPRVRRTDLPTPPDPVTTQCVARVVLTDGTMRAMLLLLARVTGERTHIRLVDLDEEPSQAGASAEDTAP